MTIQLFIQNIEKYFGSYNDTVKKAVTKFICDNWTADELPALLNETIKTHSTQYKNQPDVSFFNQIWEKKNNPELKAEQAWLQLEQEFKSDRSILCTDIVMQETIISMGGVNEFLDYRLNSHNWCKKNFIETYSKLSKQNLKHQELKILKNKAQIDYPKFPPEVFYDNVKVIGDEEQGGIMIENMKQNLSIEHKQNEMQLIGDVIKEITS